MSPATLSVLSDLLDQVQIHVGHPNFIGDAEKIITARRELDAAIAASSDDGPKQS